MKGLTSAQITEAMRRYIVPGNITIVRAGDFKKVKPPAAPTP